MTKEQASHPAALLRLKGLPPRRMGDKTRLREAGEPPGPKDVIPPNDNRSESHGSLAWSAVLALVFLALIVVRVWRLDDVPSNVTGDEVTFLSDLVRIRYFPDKVGPFSLMGDGSQPAVNFYYMTWVMRLFSEDNALLGMRLSSAIISLGVLAAFYLYLRTKVHPAPAMMATFLLGTNYVFLNFSRASWLSNGMGLILMAGLLSFLCVERSAGQGRWYWAVAGGLLAGATLYGYMAGKVFPLASLAYLGYIGFRGRLAWKAVMVRGLLFGLVALLVFLPQLVHALQNYDRFSLRTRSVFIGSVQRPYYGQSDMPGILWHQFSYTVRGFLFLEPGVSGEGIENQRYVDRSTGPVDLVTRVSFFLGLAVAIRYRKKDIVQPALALVGVLIATQLLTEFPPNFARGMFALVFVYLIIGALLDWAHSKRTFPWLSAVLALVAVGLGLWNTWHYFQWGDSRELAAARQPAIERDQVPLWITTQRRHIATGQYDLVITSEEWQRLSRNWQDRPDQGN